MPTSKRTTVLDRFPLAKKATCEQMLAKRMCWWKWKHLWFFLLSRSPHERSWAEWSSACRKPYSQELDRAYFVVFSGSCKVNSKFLNDSVKRSFQSLLREGIFCDLPINLVIRHLIILNLKIVVGFWFNTIVPSTIVIRLRVLISPHSFGIALVTSIVVGKLIYFILKVAVSVEKIKSSSSLPASAHLYLPLRSLQIILGNSRTHRWPLWCCLFNTAATSCLVESITVADFDTLILHLLVVPMRVFSKHWRQLFICDTITPRLNNEDRNKDDTVKKSNQLFLVSHTTYILLVDFDKLLHDPTVADELHIKQLFYVPFDLSPSLLNLFGSVQTWPFLTGH